MAKLTDLQPASESMFSALSDARSLPLLMAEHCQESYVRDKMSLNRSAEPAANEAKAVRRSNTAAQKGTLQRQLDRHQYSSPGRRILREPELGKARTTQ